MVEFVLVHRGLCLLRMPGIMPMTAEMMKGEEINVIPSTIITQELADSTEASVIQGMGQLPSCNWLRCPFNDGPIRVRPPDDILTCTHCRQVRHFTLCLASLMFDAGGVQVYYCSLPCQTK